MGNHRKAYKKGWKYKGKKGKANVYVNRSTDTKGAPLVRYVWNGRARRKKDGKSVNVTLWHYKYSGGKRATYATKK